MSSVMPARREWTLRRRVTALSLLMAAVLTFLAGGATTTALANRGQLDRLLGEIGPMQAAGNDLSAALVEEEAGVRGYVLNGSQADLTRYRDAVAAEQRGGDRIVSSPAATPKIQSLLLDATAATRRWRADVAEPAIAARAAGDPVAADASLDCLTRAQFDAARATMLKMQQEMQGVRDEAVTSIKDTSTTLEFVLVVAVILVIASGIALMLALQRTVVGPLTDLAVQVRAVARGDYGAAISGSGPPELARLAADVDLMRQQIASDLAEVDAARRQIEQAHAMLERQAAELVRSNRDLEQFAYVASHDLQEPLRKVVSFCQLLRRRYRGRLDERADQYIAFAVNGAQRMQRLINDLLAFSRIGQVTTAFTAVDLDRLVADELAQLELATESERAELTWSDLPVVRGEERLLATLLANLISNAMKFRRPGEPARVHLSGRRDGDRWEISCVDHGIGISDDSAERVFVIFQRLHPAESYPGTGIGLAIAKKIVEYHGGTIWIDTSYTDGAAIRFTLPAAPVDATGAVSPARPAPATADFPRSRAATRKLISGAPRTKEEAV